MVLKILLKRAFTFGPLPIRILVPMKQNGVQHVAPKLTLIQKYDFIKKSTIFKQSLQNLAKMWYSLVRLFVFTKFPND